MKEKQLEALRRITTLKYDVCRAELGDLNAEEKRLRQALGQIEENQRQTAQQDSDDVVRQSLGADVVWQAWLDRQHRALQAEMAMLRARREPAMARLKHAFGRDQVADQLLADAKVQMKARAVSREERG